MVGVKGGRPQHDFWVQGQFLQITEKNRPAAFCQVCSKIIHNTAKKRLLQHRTRCKSSSPDLPSDTDSEDPLSLGSINTPLINPMPEEPEEVIQIEVEGDWSTFYSLPSMQCADDVSISNEAKSKAFKRKIVDKSSSDSFGSLVGSSVSSSLPKNKKLMGTHSYMDSVSSEDKDNIDIALAKYIFGCNIPFSTVESYYFKELIVKLRPGYKLPTRQTIASTLLDQIHEKTNDIDAHLFGKESVLLIDGWEDSTVNTKNVVAMIHNNYGHVVFLESFDLSEHSETGEELSRIVFKSKEIARAKYSTEIYAVVSDNPSNMLEMGQIVHESDILHSGCNSHMGNLLAREIVDDDTVGKVISLQKEFKNPHFEQKIKKRIVLPMDTRCCSHRNTYENFLTNLTTIRQIVSDEQVVFKRKLKHLLFDDEFIEKVRIQKEALDPICNLVSKCQQHYCSLADAVQMWLTLEVPEQHKGNLERMQEKIFAKHALAANYLHPTYKGNSLNDNQIQIVEYYLFENLSGPGIENLNQFKSGTGIFRILSKKENLSPMAFWESLQNHTKDLANFAIKLLRIPASLAQFERVSSNCSYVHSQLRNRLTGDRSKKLLSVYYSLKSKDTNKSDEY